ncbi:DUF7674 family protein [Rhizobium populisoli]|uniref:DUF7674 family protein n=1 Tax=Rhizobium populisoli TaxID=2859785 RepID=UPI001FEB089D|nr:hypothetical protein [Rhizobium populisoli]
MFEPLLEADPTFQEKWNSFQEEFRSEREMPLYLALSDFARHLINHLETGNTHRFNEIFSVVESWHLDGDAYVREAAMVGLVEDLQNASLHQATHPGEFMPWLQPETLRAWNNIQAFWLKGTPLAGPRR